MYVLHVIPNDGVGGVETAAKSAAEKSEKIQLAFVSSINSEAGFGFIGRVIKQLLGFHVFSVNKNSECDIAVFSLWKTAFLLIYWKIRFNRPALLFLHSERSKHLVDAVLTLAALLFCDGILADSARTLELRVPQFIRTRRPSRIVSMLSVPAIDPIEAGAVRRNAGNFIYWGRFNKNKNVVSAIDLFARVLRQVPSANFKLFGPDDGTLADCIRHVESLGISHAVRFHGSTSHDELRHQAASATFFIQLSDYEGFGMSVAEAMRFGLIPIVTPVGQIGQYCKDGVNSVIVRQGRDVSDTVMKIMDDNELRDKLSRKAIAVWAASKDYATDFLEAVSEFLPANSYRKQL